ncbi:hypothetical protein [Nocardia farcinica]|uniref:hypothetical protein n=1 Tax=Nocardia farcinica TaxID=37329 RepID=UPI0034343B39
MTGTTERKDPPRTNAEWARDMQRRQDLVEHPAALRAGEWVLSTGAGGDLVGSHVAGGSVVIAPLPASGVDPESVTDAALPSITVTRTALQSIPAAGDQIVFDGVVSEVGEWRTSSSAITALQVPESGVYNMCATVWFNSGSAYLHAVILIDGITRVGGRLYEGAGAAWPSVSAVGQLYLNAGQAVNLFAVASGAARSVGAAPVFTTAIPTSLSLSMSSRG